MVLDEIDTCIIGLDGLKTTGRGLTVPNTKDSWKVRFKHWGRGRLICQSFKVL